MSYSISTSIVLVHVLGSLATLQHDTAEHSIDGANSISGGTATESALREKALMAQGDAQHSWQVGPQELRGVASLVQNGDFLDHRLAGEGLQTLGMSGNLWVLAIVGGIIVAFLALVAGIFACRIAVPPEDDKHSAFQGRPMMQLPPDSRETPILSPLVPPAGQASAAPQDPGLAVPQFQQAAGAPGPMSESGTVTSTETSGMRSGNAMAGSGLPLCPFLCVPQENRLRVIMQNLVRPEKQSLSFNVCAASTEEDPLFQVRIEERNNPKECAIYLEKLEGNRMAYLRTDDIYTGGRYTGLSLYRSWGALFGTVQPKSEGYVVLRGRTPLLYVTGSFESFRLRITTVSGHKAALLSPLTDTKLQLEVETTHDVGLMILSLLGIFKMQAASRRPSVASNAGVAGFVASSGSSTGSAAPAGRPTGQFMPEARQ